MPKTKDIDTDLDDDDEDLEDEDEAEEDDKSTNGKTKSKKMFPQEHVTKVAAKEKREGRKAGMRQALQELGFDSLEQAKEAIGQMGATDDDDGNDDATDKGKGSKQDDSQNRRAQLKLEQDRDKLRKERDDLKRDRHELKVTQALLQAGVDSSKASRSAKLLDVEVGAKDDDIKDAIEELKEEFPELFAPKKSSEEDDEDEDDEGTGDNKKKKPARGDSNPGNRPRKKAPKQTPEEAAQARLKARHPEFTPRKD